MNRGEVTGTSRLSLAAGLFLLVTGGWLGQVENGILTDTLPTAAAAGILLAGLLATAAQGRATARADVGLAALVVLALLSLHGPQAQLRTALHTAAAAIAYLAGRSFRIEAVHRKTLLAAMIIPVGYAAWQRWFLFPELAGHLAGEAKARILSGRVFSVFILPGQFSAWTAIVLPLALTTAFIGPWRLLARTLTLLLFAAFALAGSLAGPICALPSLAWFLGRSRATYVILLLTILALAASIASRPETQMFLRSNPVQLRLGTWAATIDGIRDAPWLGHGAGTFPSLYHERYRHEGADKVRHPHSWPLLVAFEHGLLGLAAWLVLAGRLFSPVSDRSARTAAVAFFLVSLLDIADLSGTLRALGCLLLGASVADRALRNSGQGTGPEHGHGEQAQERGPAAAS